MDIDIILNRRSCRVFGNNSVTDEQVNQLLKAAMAAPSAGNEQPWHFVVIRNKETLNKISAIHPHAPMAKDASVAILICGDPSLEYHKDYFVQDCSAATQNLLLAAHALGLGAVWCGVHPRKEREKELRDLLNIPEKIVPFSLVPIGEPMEKKPPANRFLSARIHLEGW